MRLIEWPFIHRGLLMCHSSNVNHPSYFGKLTELHSLLAPVNVSLSKSRACCVSSLIPGVGRVSGSPRRPCFTVLSPPLPRPSMLTGAAVAAPPPTHTHTPCRCFGVWRCGPLTGSHPDPPPSSCQSSLRVQSHEQKCLVYIYNRPNLPGPRSVQPPL